MGINLLNIEPHKVSKDLSGYITYIYGAPKTGKTTLAVKLLELNEIKGFLSNDRVFVNENLQMDYFPQAVTYAMGTVKNNNRLNQYFIDNKILEKRKKIN